MNDICICSNFVAEKIIKSSKRISLLCDPHKLVQVPVDHGSACVSHCRQFKIISTVHICQL